MATKKPKNILVAPLDWGLGHTTRCVPLMLHLTGMGHRVIFAGNEWQQAFIKASFPHIDMVHLEGYNVTYSHWNRFGQAGLLSQLPGLHKTIGTEHNRLKQIVRDLQPDGIISDNRYGLFHASVPSVIMTHQLRVRSGLGNIADRAIQKVHYKYLDRFNATWVVDIAEQGLGGTLSHTAALPAHTKYIGLLSRFEAAQVNDETDTLLILLSGPEPQRSDLSRILWQQVQAHKGKVIFIEGSDTATQHGDIPPHIIYHKWLPHEQLAPILRSAGMVVCRSGYSTLMDLAALRKKAILIHTPGQTEQEYLGKQLHQQGVFYTAKQSGFNLAAALSAAAQFPYHSLALHGAFSQHQQVLDEWVNTL